MGAPRHQVSWRPSASGSALLHQRMGLAVTLSLKEQEVAVVGEAVNHRGGPRVVREDSAPLGELPVGRQDEAADLVAVRNNPEQPWRAVPVDRHIALFIESQQRRAVHVLQEPVQGAGAPGVTQAQHQVGGGKEADRLPHGRRQAPILWHFPAPDGTLVSDLRLVYWPRWARIHPREPSPAEAYHGGIALTTPDVCWSAETIYPI